MFIYNVKVSGSLLFKIFFIIATIVILTIFSISCYKIFVLAKDNTTVSDRSSNVIEITPNNYTNILKDSHENIDKYVGKYIAIYVVDTKEETIFGGTTLNRKEGNSVKLKIKVKKKKGNIEIISNEGTTSVILINDTGEIEKTINVKEKSYYLKIKVMNFTGNVEIISE